jgi:hypothetical protein
VACRCSISPTRQSRSKSRSSTAGRSTLPGWYGGRIYASEIARGLDVFKLTPSEHLSQSEIDAASLVTVDELNPQLQYRWKWPSNATVARAYLDQLTRSKAIEPARAVEVTGALDAADRTPPAPAAIDRLDSLAAQLEQDAAKADARDGARLRSIAGIMKDRAGRLRR